MSVDRDRFIWAVDDESVQVTVLDDGQPLLKDKNITITLIRISGGHSTDIIVTEAIITLRALPPVPGLIFPSKCITSSLLPYPSVSNLTFQTGMALYFTSGKIIGMSGHEKKGNKKMPTPRHKLIHNPIPTSLFCFKILFVCFECTLGKENIFTSNC